MSAFDKHADSLEQTKPMMGAARRSSRGGARLLTDATPQWCAARRVLPRAPAIPATPSMDIAIVLEHITDAKELLQSVIELDRQG
jgi:hypothetical protein